MAAAERYSQNYLHSFLPDGYAEEGISYWSYGFSHYALLRETLWHQTQGELDLFSLPFSRQVAFFPERFQMSEGVFADFGDARFDTKPPAGLLAYVRHAFGQQEGSPVVRSTLGKSLVAQVASWDLAPSLNEGDTMVTTNLRYYFPNANVLVSRPATKQGIAITIKGGGNGGHSHNDIGSFSIGLDGTQVLGDPGGPIAYTKNTFGSKRFKSKLLNSYGHPVPSIAGYLQLDATTLQPRVISMHFSNTEDDWRLDMAPAYKVPALKAFTRTMKFGRTGLGYVEIIDDFDLAKPTEIEEALPTHGKVSQVDDRTLIFNYLGRSVKVILSGPAIFRIRQEKIEDYGNPFVRVGVASLLRGRSRTSMVITSADVF